VAENWKTVRVFISSTFRDMHAERDHLVRVVFPELKERCGRRHVHLVDVDLRWGVTEEQAVGGGALDICLDEIDSCRPYFLGLLGHRYGYIPPGHDHSITADEIYHGVLHNNLPHQLIDLRPFVEGILEGRTLFKEQVNCLVRNYQWSAGKRKYLLKQNITSGDRQTLRSIFDAYSIYQRDRSFFFFRSESLAREMAGSKTEDYFETEEALKCKLAKLKQEIIAAGLPYYEYDNLEAFGQRVLETLWGRIAAEFPEKREEVERDWLKEETELHDLFMADRTRRFVGRAGILMRMHNFVEEDSDPRLMVITGEPGCGKSALMARFTENIIRSHPDWLILSHFVGASPSSASLRRTLRRFYIQLGRALGVEEEVPEEYKELAQLFPELLQRASETHQVLLIIDALNQLEKTDNAHALRWLPQRLPQNVKVVVSTVAGELLDTLKTWRIQPNFGELAGLTEPEIKEFVTSYLEEIRKDFPTKKIQEAFYDKTKAGNPLYILVALEELRVFPVYGEVGKRVASLPDTVPELFNQVLERIEGDFDRPSVQEFTSFVACGRQGMTGEELQALLRGRAPIVNPDTLPSKLPDILFARLRRAFGAYLFERSGVMDFFHNQLKEAVDKRYLSEEVDRDRIHQVIAEYFEKRWNEPYLRALDELPHQLIEAKDWGDLERVLCDLHFIEAKCAAGMTYDLIHDYNIALDALPEAQPQKEKRLRHEARLKKHTKDLIAYAKGEIKTFDVIPSVRPWTDAEIRADTERIINHPTRLDRIKAFSQFVDSDSNVLVRFASHPGFVIQQAYNSAQSGPVASEAEEIVNTGTGDPLLLQPSSLRPDFNPHPTLIKDLGEYPTLVNVLSITPHGKRAVSGGHDGTLRLWELETGECLNILRRHTDTVSSVCMTADGKKAVSGSYDRTIRVWDPDSGECLKTIQCHQGKVVNVRVSPDGKSAIVVCEDGNLLMWELETGDRFSILGAHANVVTDVDITADRRKAVSASTDNTLQIWDLERGKRTRILEGHIDRVTSVTVTPDGKRAVSGSRDKTLRFWDLESGECLSILKGHADWVNSVRVTPDGKRAISASSDDTLRVWNLRTGYCLRTIYRDTREGVSFIGPESVDITADGKRAISFSAENLQVWDIETGDYNATLKMRTDYVKAVHFTPEGKRLISVHQKALHVCNLDSGRSLIGHEYIGPCGAMVVTPDGTKAVSASGVKGMQIWSIKTGKCINSFYGDSSHADELAVTPDGRRIISLHLSLGMSDNILRIWDLNSRECLISQLANTGLERAWCLTGDGRMIVSSTIDHKLQVWDLENGRCLRILEGNRDSVTSINILPDGNTVVSGSQDGTLRLWDLRYGGYLSKLEAVGSPVNVVRVTPDGRIAISGTMYGGLKIWDLKKKECIQTLGEKALPTHRLSISPVGRIFASVGEDNTVRLWDRESYACIAILQIKSDISSISDITSLGAMVCGTYVGEIVFQATSSFPMKPTIITAVRIWLYGQRVGWLTRKKRSNGRWDDYITSLCQWCGQRFPVSDKILDVIRAINRNAGLSPDQSICLELPDEAWEEPRLLSECPLCHRPLKFNPFIVDNRGRY